MEKVCVYRDSESLTKAIAWYEYVSGRLQELADLFTDADIEWFNPTTREVKFYAQEEPLSQRLRKTDGELQFRLGNDVVLKVSRFVGDWDSRTFKDLVLHYDVISNSEQGHFYLQDCYPLQFINDEQVQANIKLNAKQWDAFIKYLEKIGKIKK